MKISILCLSIGLLFISCNEENKEKAKEAMPILNAVDQPDIAAEMCYLTTGKPIETEMGTLRDSIKLELQVDEKDKVTGAFSWLPAEKDAMKGTLTGAKNGSFIKAAYTYMQEGTPATQPVLIKLSENVATVILNEGKEDEVTFKVNKTNCP